ncbi:unnamed protein product [Gongylonema pulchrum]|uniref:Mon2_C domain-containing protein n=1 Tax=Gongylonema pulchrum TaxID=637853 RepID=A0A183EL37_9BILA|nr:unnamed protein product [Gongylonema pulchrum]
MSRPRSPPLDEIMFAQLGSTLTATSAALGRYVQSIVRTTSEETAQQLLLFCLDFQAGLSASTRKHPATSKCVLPAQCVNTIIDFAIASNSHSEQLWTIVLRALELIITNDVSTSKCVLPAQCVNTIIDFAIASNSHSEQLWTIVLRALELIITNDV